MVILGDASRRIYGGSSRSARGGPYLKSSSWNNRARYRLTTDFIECKSEDRALTTLQARKHSSRVNFDTVKSEYSTPRWLDPVALRSSDDWRTLIYHK